jgi:hypothetical protein
MMLYTLPQKHLRSNTHVPLPILISYDHSSLLKLSLQYSIFILLFQKMVIPNLHSKFYPVRLSNVATGCLLFLDPIVDQHDSSLREMQCLRHGKPWHSVQDDAHPSSGVWWCEYDCSLDGAGQGHTVVVVDIRSRTLLVVQVSFIHYLCI